MSLDIFKAGDELEAGENAAIVEHFAAYGGMLPQAPGTPSVPVVVVDLEAIVDDFAGRAKARLILTEEAAHGLMHGLENSLVLLQNLRKNQGK